MTSKTHNPAPLEAPLVSPLAGLSRQAFIEQTVVPASVRSSLPRPLVLRLSEPAPVSVRPTPTTLARYAQILASIAARSDKA